MTIFLLHLISSSHFRYRIVYGILSCESKRFSREKSVEFYYRNNCSVVLTQKAYRRYFNLRTAPTDSVSRRLVTLFRDEGHSCGCKSPGTVEQERRSVNGNSKLRLGDAQINCLFQGRVCREFLRKVVYVFSITKVNKCKI